jgi:hypothetical protein
MHMKNTTTKYIVALLVLVALAVIASAFLTNKTAGPQTSPVTTQVSTQAQQGTQTVPQNSVNTVTTKPSTSVAPIKSTPKTVVPVTGNSYVDSQAVYYANLNSCKDAASSQYANLYAKSLEQSAFQSYYNTKSGSCYMQVTGDIRTAYATSTTDELYFRDVAKGILLMECTNMKGNTYADSDWSCTDKTTGQAISKAQYEATLSKFTVQ